MTNSTNTGSGAIAQGQSVAAGERGIAADSISGSTIATGDNPTINNIVIVGRLLEFAQVEGLLPQIKGNDFSSIAEAVEGALNARLEGDLVEAVVFVGEVLGDLINETISTTSSAPANIRSLVRAIPEHIVKKLKVLGYWDIYSQQYAYGTVGERREKVLWLVTTDMLYKKHLKIIARLGVSFTERHCRFIYERRNSDYKTLVELDMDEISVQELRMLLAGVVLDLIRIKSEDKITYQFLQEMADLFNRHK